MPLQAHSLEADRATKKGKVFKDGFLSKTFGKSQSGGKGREKVVRKISRITRRDARIYKREKRGPAHEGSFKSGQKKRLYRKNTFIKGGRGKKKKKGQLREKADDRIPLQREKGRKRGGHTTKISTKQKHHVHGPLKKYHQKKKTTQRTEKEQPERDGKQSTRVTIKKKQRKAKQGNKQVQIEQTSGQKKEKRNGTANIVKWKGGRGKGCCRSRVGRLECW